MSKEQFHGVHDYIIDHFNLLEKKLNLALNIKFIFQADNKQKTLVKVIKLPDRYSVLLDADILVSFNEEYFDSFDDESKNILIDQELALILVNYDTGKIKINKPDLITSSGIIKKYGVDAVQRANQALSLFVQQQDDKEK
jgi:hypothetical protein